MKDLWPELLERPHIRAVLGPDAAPESPHRAWPIPARIDDIVLSAGRALFVGDAAAATDPLTGEGIGQALLTGVLAADAILAAGAATDAARTRATYDRSVLDALVADHRMSMLLDPGRRATARAPGWPCASPAPRAWTRRNFARWLFEDYPRALVVTPRRWGRGHLVPARRLPVLIRPASDLTARSRGPSNGACEPD